MEVIIRSTEEEGSLLAAKIIERQVRDKARSVLGLATGRTPLNLYKNLIRLHQERGLNFSQTVTFNLDEYVGLGPDNPNSYYSFMHENFFKHINIDLQNTHIPNGFDPDLRTACNRYEAQIKEAGGIDLQLLGLGSNGHIGFNEPTGSLMSRTWLKILSRQTMKDNATFFESPGQVPSHVITMGIGTILESEWCLLLAFGEGKAQAVTQMIEGPVTSICPASALQLHPRVTVILDEPSAAGLKLAHHYRWIDSQKLEWQRYD